MEFEYEGVVIRNEEEFRQLIEQLNTDIRFANKFGKTGMKKEPLNMEYMVERYRLIKGRYDRSSFRERHDCKHCLYYERPRRCFATKECPLEQGKEIKVEETLVSRCPKDKAGNCPYGNSVGTCFGFCWKEILHERKEHDAQSKEEQTGG